jgi:hypothetical protein
MRILKIIKIIYRIAKNNLSYFLSYYDACTPEDDILSVETRRGNH